MADLLRCQSVRRFILPAVVVACWLASVSTARGASLMDVRGGAATGSQQVQIKADSLAWDEREGKVTASGDVEVAWGGATLYARLVSLLEQESTAIAEGDVRVVSGDDRLRGERVRVNYATGQGEVENGELFVKRGNFHVAAERMARLSETNYRMDRGPFTTCDGAEPSWHFTADQLEVDLQELASGRHALFYVHGLPVFYFPYLLFPVQRERQTGFLFPRFGNSTKKGLFAEVPFYWAISPSQDATFLLDYQSKRGVGTGAEYRYLRGGGNHGNLDGYLIYDTQEDRERWFLGSKLQETLPGGVQPKADLNLVSDRNFYRDYGSVSGEYNKQLLDTSVSLTKGWESYALAGEVRYLDNLDAPDNRATLQRLPQLTVTGIDRRLGETPLSFSLAAVGTNFQRTEGSQGERLLVFPRLALRHLLPGGLALTGWGGYELRLYDAWGADPGRGSHGIGLAAAGATASTTLARVYEAGWGGMTRLRHQLTPELSFSYVQNRDQDYLPFFDWDDRVVGQQFLGWALTSTLTGKFAAAEGRPVYRDLLYLRLSQGYNLAGGRRNLLVMEDPGHRLTDLRIEARLTPLEKLTIATDSYLNLHDLGFSQADLTAQYTFREKTYLGLSYQYAQGQLHYLEGRVGVDLLKPFTFTYSARYTFDGNDFLESAYGLEYRQQCWSVLFTYRDRPGDQAFTVNFSLLGIGSLGSMRLF